MDAARHLVVVGAGPAGLSAARGYRDAGGEARVTLLAGEGHAPYRRPPLSKDYLRGDLEAHELVLEDAGFYAERAVGVVTAEAVGLDVDGRVVTLEDGRRLEYDACVVATGGVPQRLPVPGADGPGVLVLRTLADSDRLAGRARAGGRIAVVGTGFIGCEVAASLRAGGADVVLVGEEDAPQAARLGQEVGGHLAGWLASDGVALALGARVTEVLRGRDGRLAIGRDGAEDVACDLVVMAAGVRPRVGLAAVAGLELAFDGRAIAVDAGLATSAPGVWACGDVAAAEHPLAGRRLRVEHWGDALAQGEAAGRRIAGDADARWEAVPGFWSTIGDHTLKQAAWQDGHDEVRVVEHPGGAFTAWYGREGVCVGVLTHERDEDYERGERLVAAGAPLP